VSNQIKAGDRVRENVDGGLEGVVSWIATCPIRKLPYAVIEPSNFWSALPHWRWFGEIEIVEELPA
jgi:hypothetical protein